MNFNSNKFRIQAVRNPKIEIGNGINKFMYKIILFKGQKKKKKIYKGFLASLPLHLLYLCIQEPI